MEQRGRNGSLDTRRRRVTDFFFPRLFWIFIHIQRHHWGDIRKGIIGKWGVFKYTLFFWGTIILQRLMFFEFCLPYTDDVSLCSLFLPLSVVGDRGACSHAYGLS